MKEETMMTRMHGRTAVVGAVMMLVLALAQAPNVDVTGKWAFNVETAAGAGTPTMTFKQDGEKLTGHYSGQLGESDLTGTVKGADISFSFTIDAQGTMIKATYSGTVENKDSLKGKVVLEGLGDGTFTAKRQ
jgi:hypothetical protein